MALSTEQWNALVGLDVATPRSRKAMARDCGGEASLDELLALGHLDAQDGQKVVRSRVSVDAFRLYGVLPGDGRAVANSTARRDSRLPKGRYEAARALLLTTDEIARSRGPGGAVRRVEVEAPPMPTVEREEDLYEPLRESLLDDPDTTADFHAVTVTARGTGGRQRGEWTRPDVVEVTVERYKFLPQVTVEVASYEVKPFRHATRLLGVYEASAHQRAAHYATLVIEWPDHEVPPEATQQECQRLGVGLATMQADGGLQVWIPPARHEPEPSALDAVLAEALRDDSVYRRYLAAIGKKPTR